MNISNESDIEVSWFCFNSDDLVKIVALASGDLKPNDPPADFNPPDNVKTIRYFVRFTAKGGGVELAGITITKRGSATLAGKDGEYYASNP